MSYRVVITGEAAEQAAAIRDWWRSNRPGSPEKFDEELADAIERLGRMPLPAPVYRRRPAWYRVLLRVTRNHVYFTVDVEARTVTVTTIWGGLRRGGPR